MDNEPSVVSVEDTARMSQRTQRFCAEGEKTPKKKLSIDDLARSLVSDALPPSIHRAWFMMLLVRVVKELFLLADFRQFRGR